MVAVEVARKPLRHELFRVVERYPQAEDVGMRFELSPQIRIAHLLLTLGEKQELPEPIGRVEINDAGRRPGGELVACAPAVDAI